MSLSLTSKLHKGYTFLIHKKRDLILKIPQNYEFKKLFSKVEGIFSEFLSREQLKSLLQNPKKGNLDLLEIEITANCNLNCAHCYQGNDRYMYNDLPFESIKNWLKEGSKLGAYELIITGGEPFLHKDFFKILKISDSEGYRTSIVTNGTLITDEIASLLSRYNIYRIAISLDGFKTTHELKRGKNTWEKSINAIKILQEKDIAVTVPVTIDQTNINEINTLVNFLNKLKVNKIILMLTAKVGKAKLQMNKFRVKRPFLIRNMYKQLVRPKCKTLFTPKNKPCWIFFGELSIGYDGKLYPCTSFKNYKIFPLGNLFQSSLTEIYFDRKWISFFDNINKYNLRCRNCKYEKMCQYGCRARAFKNGDLFGCDPFARYVYFGGKIKNVHQLIW